MKNCSSRPTVTLVGASVRAAAQSAKRANLKVVGFDLFGDSDCRAACDQFVLITPQEQPGFCDPLPRHDAVLSVANSLLLFVGGFSRDVCSLSSTLSPVFQSTVLHSTVPQSAAGSKQQDPHFLERLASAVGMKFPRTLPSDDASRRHVSERITSTGERWLCKDVSSSGGIHVRWVSDQQSTPLRQHSNSICYQQWIAGKRFGASYLSDGNESVMLGVCRSLHTRKHPFPFVYGGSLGPVSLTRQQTETLGRLGDTLVAMTALTGLFGIDVIVDAQENLWLLEINPRWTASSELIERDLIRRSILQQHESLIGSACKCQVPKICGEWRSPSLAELKRRLSHNNQVINPFVKKVVFARETGTLDRDALSQAETNGITCYDLPDHGAPITKGHPLCSLIGSTQSLCQGTSNMRLRNSVRLAQAAIR
ncbi:ATP-grasp domain-containing protein [Novipirellula rosea]|uniref:ATP-grasp domain-containing protein n=1 Tax=Novipirellula rosea TaxID=1031540 RepID=UPI0031EF37AA